MLVHCFTSKEEHNSASSQASCSLSIHPAASESQHLSTPDTRAKTLSEPLPQHTVFCAVSSPPSATATKTHSVASKESASSSAHHGKLVALSPPLESSQSPGGASSVPQKVTIGGDEVKDLPQINGPSAGTEGHSDAKEQHQSKPSSRGNERRYSRDGERDRLNSAWSRDRERHYRDRSRERESDGDRHRYRRDSHDYHHYRSNRDHLPPYNHNRDCESERYRERTMHHPRERDRDRCSNHYHHYHHRYREDSDRERRGHGYTYREESHCRKRRQQDSCESRIIKDKSSSRERESYPSKGGTSLPATVLETSSKSRGNPLAPLSMSGSAPNKEDQNQKRTSDNRSKERDNSSEVSHAKKHKKSKKKKKSKDKERHRESG